MGSVDRLNPQFLLRNAHRHMRRMNKYRGLPLWSLMSDLTSHGSTISMDLCRQMGWDPHANVNSDLPRANYVRERPTQETSVPQKRPGGLDCGVDLRTGKGVCVCGRCSTANRGESP